jgi:predicted metal-binding protein
VAFGVYSSVFVVCLVCQGIGNSLISVRTLKMYSSVFVVYCLECVLGFRDHCLFCLVDQVLELFLDVFGAQSEENRAQDECPPPKLSFPLGGEPKP